MDEKLIFSDAQAITVSAQSSNDIDLGAAGLDIGAGTPIYLNIFLDTAFTTSANTLAITLRHGTTSKPDTTILTVLEATATSSLLTVGLLRKIALPNDLAEFIDLYYTCSTTLAAGKITAFLSLD